MITNLAFPDVFGVNATQNLETITINKSDLPGLNSVNPESLLAALLLKIQAVFEGMITDELNNVITTETGEPITYNHQNRYLKLNNFLWRVQLVKLREQNEVRHVFVFEIYTPDVDNYGQPINLGLL